MAKCEFKSLPDAKLQRQRNTSFSFSYDEINISETLTNYAKGKTYYIHTYGCQANYRDEEIISGILTKDIYLPYYFLLFLKSTFYKKQTLR